MFINDDIAKIHDKFYFSEDSFFSKIEDGYYIYTEDTQLHRKIYLWFNVKASAYQTLKGIYEVYFIRFMNESDKYDRNEISSFLENNVFDNFVQSLSKSGWDISNFVAAKKGSISVLFTDDKK